MTLQVLRFIKDIFGYNYTYFLKKTLLVTTNKNPYDEKHSNKNLRFYIH